MHIFSNASLNIEAKLQKNSFLVIHFPKFPENSTEIIETATENKMQVHNGTTFKSKTERANIDSADIEPTNVTITTGKINERLLDLLVVLDFFGYYRLFVSAYNKI